MKKKIKRSAKDDIIEVYLLICAKITYLKQRVITMTRQATLKETA